MEKQDIDLIVIFSGSPWKAGLVKSKLEDEGIEAFLKDEIMGTYNPWWVTPGGAGAVKVVISSADYEKAKEIVDGFKQ